MSRIIARLFIVIGLLLFAARADVGAATYWVNPTSSGQRCINSATDPGAANSSKTIQQGLACIGGNPGAGAGHTVEVKAGTYAEILDEAIIGNFMPKGTAGSYFTLRASPGDTVTIRGSGTMNLRLCGAVPTSNFYTTINGITFDGTNTNERNVLFGCSTSAPSYITFSNNFIINTPFFNPLLVGKEARHITISGNKIHGGAMDAAGGKGGDFSHCFYFEGQDSIIENNEIYDCASYGLHIYSGWGPPNIPANNIVRFNNIYNYGISRIPGAAGLLMAGDNSVAYGNIVHDASTNHTNAGIMVDSSYNGYATGNQIYNNTVYNVNSNGLYEVIANQTIWRNNISFGNGTAQSFNGDNRTADHQYCNSGCTGTGTINSATNPFIGGGDFHLQTGSTAINAGIANISPGVTIPACSGGTTTGCYNGTAPDIGALETGVPTAGGGPPTLTPNLTTVTPGAPILVTVDDDDVNERVENVGDWLGIFAPGATVPLCGCNDGVSLFDWFWMSGTKTAPPIPISDAVIAFTAPLTPGNYEFRFYQNGSNSEADRIATAPFTVVSPGVVLKFNISSLKIGPSVTWKIGVP